MPGGDPIPPCAFDFDGVRYTFDPAEFNAEQPLITLLDDGRLLRASSFDDAGLPVALAEVPCAKASRA